MRGGVRGREGRASERAETQSHSLYLEQVEDEGAAVVQVVDHLEVIDVAVHRVGQLEATDTEEQIIYE